MTNKIPAEPIQKRNDGNSFSVSQRRPLLLDFAVLFQRLIEPGSLVVTIYGLFLIIVGPLTQKMTELYSVTALLAGAFYVGLAEVIGAYDPETRFAFRIGARRVMTAIFATLVFLLTIGFLLKMSDEISREWAIISFITSALVLLILRAITTLWIRSLKAKGIFDQRVAIYGAGDQGDRLARYISGNDRLTIELVGFFDDRAEDRLPVRTSALPLVGGLDELISMIRANMIEQVIIALPWAAEDRLNDVVAALAITPVRIRLAPDLASFTFAQRPFVLLGDLPVMTLFERPISGFDQIFKRLEDLLLGGLALLILAPLFVVIAIWIKLDSVGPVFFRQDREGFNNQTFKIWKFRSMYTDKLEFTAINQASKDDPRVTKVGRFIRRTSIDELPQLFNVLIGDMSLVGPRPHAPSTKAGGKLLGEVVQTYAARHKVKPGITGWAQAQGWRGETDTEEKLVRRLEHDLFYIENWSVGFDLYIILKTAFSILTGKNAY